MTKTNYIETKITLTEQQKKKIAAAYKNKTDVVLNLKPSNVGDDGTLFLTQSQINKVDKAFSSKKGVNLKLSQAQIRYNVKQGGQLASIAARALPYILPVAKKVLPALGLGALSGLADKAVKSIFGDGMYISKNGNTASVQSDGEGLYIRAVPEKFEGDGMFLVQNGRIQDGSGLLSSIPILGPILKSIF